MPTVGCRAPLRRDGAAAAARRCTALSKLCGEHLLRQIHAEHGLPYNVLRYLFVYGPRQFAGMGYKSVIVKNFERLLDGQPPIVNGDGSQALDYVFVDDAVDAAIRALETEISGEVFNIGSGVPTTVNALIDLMQRVAGSALPKRYEPRTGRRAARASATSARPHACSDGRRTPR